MIFRRVAVFLMGGGLALAVLAQSGLPAGYPDKPVRVIVPYPPGGGGDAVFRLITEPLGTMLGKTVFFEYKPGAGGTIGVATTAHSDPDGYTVGIGSSDAVALAPHYMRLNYDPLKDLQPMTIVAEMPLVLLVRADSPLRSLKDLLDAAKSKPGSVTYGTPGAGSSPNIAGVLVGKDSGTELIHVPYKGTAPALQDLFGGHVTAVITSGFDAVPLQRAGRVRAIAVTGTQRYPLLPQAPTFGEAGIRSVDDLKVWFGLFAPVSTPRPIVEKLVRDIQQIVGRDDFRSRAAELGFVPVGMTAQQFKVRLAADHERFGAMVKRTGVKPD